MFFRSHFGSSHKISAQAHTSVQFAGVRLARCRGAQPNGSRRRQTKAMQRVRQWVAPGGAQAGVLVQVRGVRCARGVGHAPTQTQP